MKWLTATNYCSSPLLKIPALFTGTMLTVLGTSPPTRPPSSEEKAKYKGKDRLDSELMISVVSMAYKVIYWGNFICETAVILAEHFPSSLSEDIMSLLSPNPIQARHIRGTPVWLTGCALMCLGGGLRLLCYRTLGKFFTWQMSVKKDHALITHGPYSIVRHPAYLGGAMVGLGTVLTHFGPGSWYHERIGWDSWGSRLFTGMWGGWLLFIAGMLISRVPTEDAILRKEFGVKWEAWAKKTPYRLIPYIY